MDQQPWFPVRKLELHIFPISGETIQTSDRSREQGSGSHLAIWRAEECDMGHNFYQGQAHPTPLELELGEL